MYVPNLNYLIKKTIAQFMAFIKSKPHVNNYIARSYRFVIVITRRVIRKTIKANISHVLKTYKNRKIPLIECTQHHRGQSTSESETFPGVPPTKLSVFTFHFLLFSYPYPHLCTPCLFEKCTQSMAV